MLIEIFELVNVLLFFVLMLYLHFYPESFIVHTLRAMQEVRLSPRIRRRIIDPDMPGAFDGIRELISVDTGEVRQEWGTDGDIFILLSETHKPDLSEKVASGEIKSTGKSVSIDDVIADIDKHLEKEDDA